jgi:DNA modification methylase
MILKVALTELALWERNYRRGQIDAIVRSVQEFGFMGAVRVRLENDKYTVYAGNHALKALLKIWDEGLPAPIGIEVDGSSWMVPCVDISHLSPEQAIAFAIADNRIQELGDNDTDQLTTLLQELAAFNADLLTAAGYDLSFLPSSVPEEEAEKDGQEFIDRAEELQGKWAVQLGDVYEVGRHRLMCGDSTSSDDLHMLFPDSAKHKGRLESQLLMVTDPPYGVEYDADWRAEFSGGNYATGTIANDDRADWTEVWELWNAQVMYVWHGGLHAGTVANSLSMAGYDIRAQIIWNKSSMVFSRGAYHWKHEPCWYAVRKGSTANWQGDRTQTTVWDCGNGSACAKTGDEADEFHAGHISQKPVELFKRPILNHTEPGAIILDPFAGSGSCLIACELTRRVCYTMELEPKFVAAILERATSLGMEVRKLD